MSHLFPRPGAPPQRPRPAGRGSAAASRAHVRLLLPRLRQRHVHRAGGRGVPQGTGREEGDSARVRYREGEGLRHQGSADGPQCTAWACEGCLPARKDTGDTYPPPAQTPRPCGGSCLYRCRGGQPHGSTPWPLLPAQQPGPCSGSTRCSAPHGRNGKVLTHAASPVLVLPPTPRAAPTWAWARPSRWPSSPPASCWAATCTARTPRGWRPGGEGGEGWRPGGEGRGPWGGCGGAVGGCVGGRWGAVGAWGGAGSVGRGGATGMPRLCVGAAPAAAGQSAAGWRRRVGPWTLAVIHYVGRRLHGPDCFS